MTERHEDRQDPARPALSDGEIRSTLYFAVGVTSESGYKAYQLAVAGDNPRTAAIEPADRSGYTIGTIQVDLGQHYQPNVPNGENVPRELVSGYQAWARVEQRDWVLTPQQEARTIQDLGRDGNAIRADGGATSMRPPAAGLMRSSPRTRASTGCMPETRRKSTG